jgi:hypothetical protein
MQNIKKIKDYENSFPTKYGLDADGTCYSVNSEFNIRVLEGYDKEGKINDLDILVPIWKKISLIDNDLIMTSKRGAFLLPDGKESYIECMPDDTSGVEGPKFDSFPVKFLDKIGKQVMTNKPMNSKERKDFVTERSI